MPSHLKLGIQTDFIMEISVHVLFPLHTLGGEKGFQGVSMHGKH